MKLGHLLFGLFALSMLVGAVVSYHGIPIFFFSWNYCGSTSHICLLAMLDSLSLYTSGSLLGIWVAMGGSLAPWRFVGATLTLAVCVFLCRTVWAELTMENMLLMDILFLLLYMVATSLPLLIARAAGLRLQHLDRRNQDFVNALVRLSQAENGGEVDHAAVKRRWPQWSLSSILLWTAAIAILLSTLSVLGILHEFLIHLPVACMGIFVVTLLALWAALGNARFWVRIMVFSLIVGATAVVSVLSDPFVAILVWSYHVMPIGVFVLLSGLLCIVRAAGYRLTWGLDARD